VIIGLLQLCSIFVAKRIITEGEKLTSGDTTTDELKVLGTVAESIV